jgi:hypothetical protein
VAGLLVGLGVDRVERRASRCDEALRAVDDPLVALADGVVRHARDVGAGVGLGQAERGELRLLGQATEVLALELLGAAEAQRARGEAVARDRGADARTAPAELLLDEAPSK